MNIEKLDYNQRSCMKLVTCEACKIFIYTKIKGFKTSVDMANSLKLNTDKKYICQAIVDYQHVEVDKLKLLDIWNNI